MRKKDYEIQEEGNLFDKSLLAIKNLIEESLSEGAVDFFETLPCNVNYKSKTHHIYIVYKINKDRESIRALNIFTDSMTRIHYDGKCEYETLDVPIDLLRIVFTYISDNFKRREE